MRHFCSKAPLLFATGPSLARILVLVALLACSTASAGPSNAVGGDRQSSAPGDPCSSVPTTAPASRAAADCAAADKSDRPAESAGNRSEASISIAENTQGAFLLRELLPERMFQFFGRFEGELALYDIRALDDEDDIEARRFRIGIAGWSPWFERLSYKLEFDLMDSSSAISSAYLNLDFKQYGTVSGGNLDSSQSLSASTGSLSQLFMEAPLPVEAFGLSKRIGLSWERAAPRSGLYLMIFGRDLNSDAKHQGVAGRAWFNPYRSSGGVWHVGASILREDINDETRLNSRPESHVTDIRLADTGSRDDVASTRRLGLELAGATGSFSTRFEYMLNDWRRTDGSNNRFRGAYLEGGHFFGGVPFRYRNGKFLRPDLTGYGMAWELAWRVSWLDLNDGDVQGGEEVNVGLAANVYPEPGFRAQLNLIQVNSDEAGGDGLLLQARLQFNW